MIRFLLLVLLAGTSACRAEAPRSAANSGCGGEAVAAAVAAEPLPALSGRVVDQADLLSPAAEARVTERLAALERRTTDQLVVITVADLKEEAIERYGLRLGRGWGIGRKHVNNGVLLIVAPNERRVRIEVGCGLEGLLTDERARRIIDLELLHRFAAGSYEEGIDAGVEAIAATLGSDLKRPQPRWRKAA